MNVNDPIVVTGYAIRLPGGVNSIEDFEQLLFEGRSAIGPMPGDRYDRELYFDTKRGVPGKAYTQLGGCVDAWPLDKQLEARIAQLGSFDLTHRQFAQVACRAWASSLRQVPELKQRCGIFVGHSGGTDQGGPLAMAGMADMALAYLDDVPDAQLLSERQRIELKAAVAKRLREHRPRPTDDSVHFNAYSAASLAAQLLELGGPREVIDAACASSLIGLSHAITGIHHGHMDAAIVGGATYNNIDNLILFSQSQACSDQGSCPFDRKAGGLISSEGYVAITITKQSIAQKHGLNILGVIQGVGVASDGRGKSLWAPRTEGQQLAIRRGYGDTPLTIDYLEAHATSTQVGDATEIQSLSELIKVRDGADGNAATRPLRIGSAKSNLGHTLEAAGLVGLVKLLISMRRGEIPPSINFREPAPEIAAVEDQIRVVDQVTPWPSHGQAKRCAVNAFGIGGLNGHALLTSSAVDSATVQLPFAEEPIAIVGRGLVLAGAQNVEQFANQMRRGDTAIRKPSAQRWRDMMGVQAVGTEPFTIPTNIGGYIEGYQFNGQPYRIPPKQVQLANPIQIMLIDAVAQAAGEADQGKWNTDRQRTSVVVGTIFGGEFSHQLQVGLRLPEICREISGVLKRQGFSPEMIEAVAKGYRSRMLQQFSALLDETGSFTASTLASRIAKTFDLMGGACAIDADDASGNWALMVAADQLRSGKVDAVVCGVSQRSMDLVAYRDLLLRNRLVRSGRIQDIPLDCSRILPGEGVAVLMLKRLSDARRDGNPIFGVIDDVRCGQAALPLEKRHQSMAADPINQQIVKTVGYLPGAHSVVRLIAETANWQQAEPTTTLITAIADDGFYVECSVRHPRTSVPQRAVDYNFAPQNTVSRVSPTGPSVLPALAPVKSSFTSDHLSRSILIEGANAVDFEAALQEAVERPERYWERSATIAEGPQVARHVAAVMATSPVHLSGIAKLLLTQWQAGKRVGVLDRELGLLWDRGCGRDRVAWAFPGQGAQYSAVPAVFQEDTSALSFLKSFDDALKAFSEPPVSPRLADHDQQLGHDVWWTQLWVLAVSAGLADSLQRAGLRPDMVFGHSFGECGAALHAGMMSLPQAIRFAKLRSEAVVMTSRERGQLLSVRATPNRVDAVLSAARVQVCITHHNAPEQTVVAGGEAEIAKAKEALQRASIASVVIPVPAAFHSPALETAKQKLRIGFGHERLRPPSVGFFSMMQTRYLAEADEVRDSLVDQLTEPLLYCSGVNRVVQDGCGLIVDVGPSDMLNRLHRSIVGQDSLCISLDSHTANHANRLQWIQLASQIVRGSVTADLPTTLPANSLVSSPSMPREARQALANKDLVAAHSSDEVEILDVTRRGRNRTVALDPMPSELNGSHFAAPDTAAKVAPNVSALVDKPNLVTPVRTVAKPATTQKHVEQFLIDLVVELTGYSPEVIDFQADLEAELGVDSIKKAQVIGELAEWASIELDLRSMKLSQFQTLADIAKLAEGSTASTLEVAVHQQMEPVANGDIGHAVSRHQAQVPVMSRDQSVQQLESWMIDFVVDQTGYSPDIIDMDADLEAELGVDSIKKAQLLGELVNHYDLSGVDLRKLKLSQFMTLASIRDFIADHVFPAEADSATSTLGISTVVHPSSVSDHEPVIPRGIAAAESNGYHISAQSNRNGTTAAEGKKKRIRRQLRGYIDADPSASGGRVDSKRLDGSVAFQTASSGVNLLELANEIGVHPQSLGPWLFAESTGKSSAKSSKPAIPIPAHGACRFGLKVEAAPRLPEMPLEPQWKGDALVIGHNTLATELMTRLKRAGVNAHQLSAKSVTELDDELDGIWHTAETPHLFITTPHDPAAAAVENSTHWEQRRDQAIVIPFRSCQRWMQRMIDLGRMTDATLATVVNAGGDFGFTRTQIAAPESGAMAGLTKAMLIESWMRGFRETPMKVIDVKPETTMSSAVDGILRELACPSHDEEVVVDGEQRWAVRPDYLPLTNRLEESNSLPGAHPITRGGTWVISGGGRGITALTAMALAEKHGLNLHLLGTAPHPQLSESVRRRAIQDRPALRREIMHQAQQQGTNPIETWRDTEKAIEIDITLQECRQRGIEAYYHSVDVSNAADVAEIVAAIRQQHGPIRGVLHGAGAGQDARFDRKRIDKVEKCIRAKVDGAYALADATLQDPLEWFVGFGSISGRFGANGHTDYSLANDMLAKVIGQLKARRPETACVTFHWHAWGDIGMATKPEAKLALEMIGMEFMPAHEGLQHFMNELSYGGEMTEVLITDRNYIRKFFPGLGESTSDQLAMPLLDPSGVKRAALATAHQDFDENKGWSVTLDPTKDRFLVDHRVGGIPTLPFVVAIEMMAEAATQAIGRKVRHFRDVEALHPIKFPDGETFAIEVLPDGETPHRWKLVADLRRKDGRIVKAGLLRFCGSCSADSSSENDVDSMPSRILAHFPSVSAVWPIQYLDTDAPIYHGETLQCLRALRVDGNTAVGMITAPSLVQLGGVERPADGWLVPCAVMDAMLYGSAVLAYHVAKRGSLPVRFESIDVGRFPQPGEPLQLHAKVIQHDDSGATLDVDLVGLNHDHLLALRNYRLHWLQ